MELRDLTAYLATTGGGYTLWIGAGASVALTSSATPTWGALVDQIASHHSLLPEGGWGSTEMADRGVVCARAPRSATPHTPRSRFMRRSMVLERRAH